MQRIKLDHPYSDWGFYGVILSTWPLDEALDVSGTLAVLNALCLPPQATALEVGAGAISRHRDMLTAHYLGTPFTWSSDEVTLGGVDYTKTLTDTSSSYTLVVGFNKFLSTLLCFDPYQSASYGDLVQCLANIHARLADDGSVAILDKYPSCTSLLNAYDADVEEHRLVVLPAGSQIGLRLGQSGRLQAIITERRHVKYPEAIYSAQYAIKFVDDGGKTVATVKYKNPLLARAWPDATLHDAAIEAGFERSEIKFLSSSLTEGVCPSAEFTLIPDKVCDIHAPAVLSGSNKLILSRGYDLPSLEL